MKQAPKTAGPAPSRDQLHEAALRHLARFATTETGLVRVLDRRIARWARTAAQEGIATEPCGTEAGAAAARLDARAVAKACTAAGLVDDAQFAAARATRLVRAGRSSRAVAAHLAAKGIAADLVQAVLPDPDLELASALAYAKRRRIGPFRTPPDDTTRTHDLGALARAGFTRDAAEQALQMSPDQAIAAVAALRRG
jgi:regulatory protein